MEFEPMTQRWKTLTLIGERKKKKSTTFSVLGNEILQTGLKAKISSIFLSFHTICSTEINKLMIFETYLKIHWFVTSSLQIYLLY